MISQNKQSQSINNQNSFSVMNINSEATENTMMQYPRKWKIYMEIQMRNILKWNWMQIIYRCNNVLKGKFGNEGQNIFLNSLFVSLRIILKLRFSTFLA
jgi:hypothetical protein